MGLAEHLDIHTAADLDLHEPQLSEGGDSISTSPHNGGNISIGLPRNARPQQDSSVVERLGVSPPPPSSPSPHKSTNNTHRHTLIPKPSSQRQELGPHAFEPHMPSKVHTARESRGRQIEPRSQQNGSGREYLPPCHDRKPTSGVHPLAAPSSRNFFFEGKCGGGEFVSSRCLLPLPNRRQFLRIFEHHDALFVVEGCGTVAYSGLQQGGWWAG